MFRARTILFFSVLDSLSGIRKNLDFVLELVQEYGVTDLCREEKWHMNINQIYEAIFEKKTPSLPADEIEFSLLSCNATEDEKKTKSRLKPI